MSVIYSPLEAAAWLDCPAEWACIECARPIEGPAVYWHATTLLLFHPDCAFRMAPHLIADAREAQLAGDPNTNWRRRAALVVRHRLKDAEKAL